MGVAEEREKLAPQVEEARWRARQLEKELAESQVGGRGVGAGWAPAGSLCGGWLATAPRPACMGRCLGMAPR